MSKKQIVLEEDTRISFNKARAEMIKNNPKIIRLTDDLTVKLLCNKYLEGTNGKWKGWIG